MAHTWTDKGPCCTPSAWAWASRSQGSSGSSGRGPPSSGACPRTRPSSAGTLPRDKGDGLRVASVVFFLGKAAPPRAWPSLLKELSSLRLSPAGSPNPVGRTARPARAALRQRPREERSPQNKMGNAVRKTPQEASEASNGTRLKNTVAGMSPNGHRRPGPSPVPGTQKHGGWVPESVPFGGCITMLRFFEDDAKVQNDLF